MNTLIKGLIARLKAYSALVTLIGTRIFTDVPQKATFPYVTIDVSSDEAYNKTAKSKRFQVVFNSWSREKDMAEAANIIQKIEDSIDRQETSITLDSGTLVMLQLISEDCYKDPDGITWHGVGIYNAYIDLGV